MSASSTVMTVVEVVFGGGGLGVLGTRVLDRFFDRGSRRADETAKLVQTELSKQKAADEIRDKLQRELVERATYFETSVGNCYQQCGELRREVEGLRAELYTAFEGMEDRVIPMLNQEPINPPAITAEIRKIVHGGRANLRRSLLGEQHA